MIREANMHWQYVDTESGLIMPWYTLPCLQWLKQQDVSKWEVFEYGAGYSTIWWRLNSKIVRSIDDSEIWADAMGTWFTKNKDTYTSRIIVDYHRSTIDCVVIDGAWRKDCLFDSYQYVRQGGCIIIDNWGQEDFPDTEFAEKLLEGWEKQLFKQPNHTTWVTAVFRKP